MGRAARSISIKVLRDLIEYNPETGALLWKERDLRFFVESGARLPERAWKAWNRRYSNMPAFTCLVKGYAVGAIFGIPFKAHRVAWALHYGAWPEDQIDHINGNRSDNRIENLRCVDGFGNAQNRRLRKDNKSGTPGVIRRGNKWRSRINVNGQHHVLGTFDTVELAVQARKSAEQLFNFHENHGKPKN